MAPYIEIKSTWLKEPDVCIGKIGPCCPSLFLIGLSFDRPDLFELWKNKWNTHQKFFEVKENLPV